jgi:hypothetical protein
MRPVLCSTSRTSDFKLKRASSQHRACAQLAGGSVATDSSSQAASNPAFTNVGARSQAEATPWASSQVAIVSAPSKLRSERLNRY